MEPTNLLKYYYILLHGHTLCVSCCAVPKKEDGLILHPKFPQTMKLVKFYTIHLNFDLALTKLLTTHQHKHAGPSNHLLQILHDGGQDRYLPTCGV